MFHRCLDRTTAQSVPRRLLLYNLTDHNALKGILDAADANDKLVRWRHRLSKMAFNVVYRAGIKYQDAKVLSRTPTIGDDHKPIDNALQVMLVVFPPN